MLVLNGFETVEQIFTTIYSHHRYVIVVHSPLKFRKKTLQAVFLVNVAASLFTFLLRFFLYGLFSFVVK
jgi:hypothetical protein